MVVEDMLKQLNDLLSKTEKFIGKERESGISSVEAGILANRLEASVTRLSMNRSVYREQLKRGSGLSSERRLIHNLEVTLTLRDDIQAGWTETVVELVHADTYSDYLEMADALLGKGYKDPAAVITGTSLEVHVRALCVKNGVTTAVAGRPKKATTMNADLKKADVYDGLQEKEVTAWMGLRNSAAHGDYGAYDHAQVRRFLDGVQAFMKKYPA
ncbi:hypothetical protein SAMN02745831_05990 [Streptomyces sp. PgraA7]|uniref:hypothetical protein n=1 Tax=Streptomyces sp. PgraA7 TaxID=1157641 RepID=UPI000B6E262C|nr:hypothetical protein [Streptomyces sp. PgraA7]MYW99082.1 hypothetical protein [Streptomyces sp. SID8378]SNB89698.1 hypothetical protein SAMN02745831_05990 [Streptomyces sp. PgraA7]